ncbi:MAG: winged helix-turn-helix domain-containing protein [Acidobacteria bacterium]|nr:winged helix-turn-helix domain-containing protein [Acidobacteriota bacterium]
MQNNDLHTFGDFTLDVAMGLLTHNGEQVKLAPKVYLSLVYLVKNAGRVVSKDELFSELWADTFVEDNALSYTISQLRKALAAYDEDTVFVETVPRRGFRFAADVAGVFENAIEPRPETFIERRTIEEVWIEEAEEEHEIATADKLLPPRSAVRPKWPLIAAFVLIAAVGAYWFQGYRDTVVRPRSVAVVPLQHIGGEHVDRSILLGMTYALISQLGRSNELVVRPLASTLSAFEADPDPIAVGRKLGVDTVVEWNLQLSEGQFRVNARSINIEDGRQLWNESFIYSESDLFKVQDAVSDMTSRSLIANLSVDENNRLHARPTSNNYAYQAYLRGRFHWNKRDLEGFRTAQELFEQAIALDQNFADTHAGLADVYLGFYDYGYKPATETVSKALASANQALQIDPRSAEAYSTIASIEFLHDRNIAAAEASFRRAIEMSPNTPTARLRFGWMLSVVGRLDEGLEQLQIAETVDPTSHIVQTNIAYNHILRRDLAGAEERLKNVLKTTAGFSLPHWYLGTVYYLQGKESEAIESYLKAYELDLGSKSITRVREAIAANGQKAAFLSWRAELEKNYETAYFPPSNIALVASLQRDREATLRWLSESERVKDPWILQILHDPEYDFLKGDPTYDSLIAGLLSKS